MKNPKKAVSSNENLQKSKNNGKLKKAALTAAIALTLSSSAQKLNAQSTMSDDSVKTHISEGVDNVELDSNNYLNNGKEVSYKGAIIQGADAASHVVLGKSFSKDANKVYYRTNVIEGADPKTIEIVSDKYSKDKNNVYFITNVVLGADPETFVKYEGDLYRDRYYLYKNGAVYESPAKWPTKKINPGEMQPLNLPPVKGSPSFPKKGPFQGKDGMFVIPLKLD